MKKIYLLLSAVISFVGVLGLSANTFADSAGWSYEEACKINPDAAACNTQTTAPDFAIALINIVIGVLGVAAVINLIISGYRYVTAQGAPEVLAKARNGIIFSVVGLVVAILAFAIVNFIAGSMFS